jgi:hypothetical protein
MVTVVVVVVVVQGHNPLTVVHARQQGQTVVILFSFGLLYAYTPCPAAHSLTRTLTRTWVPNADGSSYPYYGWPCHASSDCGECYTDRTCTCARVNATIRCCTPGTPAPPSPPFTPPYADKCAVSADRPSCTCGDSLHPPFDVPKTPIPAYKDYHFPETEMKVCHD